MDVDDLGARQRIRDDGCGEPVMVIHESF